MLVDDLIIALSQFTTAINEKKFVVYIIIHQPVRNYTVIFATAILMLKILNASGVYSVQRLFAGSFGVDEKCSLIVPTVMN